ncbi:MAG: HmuY family protein [Deltaproteobacteria bacterium]
MIKKIFLYPVLAIAALFLFSCDKEVEPIEAKTTDILTDAIPQTGKYTYFSFKTGTTVADTEVQSNKWDFGLKLTTFIVNSGISGPGIGGVLIQDGVFNEISEAPESGYRTDQTGNLAIKADEWYVYNSTNHTFAPKAGKVFIFKTGEGKYAKMEILSATPVDANGNTVTPPTFPSKIKYTIRYIYQPDGSRKF